MVVFFAGIIVHLFLIYQFLNYHLIRTADAPGFTHGEEAGVPFMAAGKTSAPLSITHARSSPPQHSRSRQPTGAPDKSAQESPAPCPCAIACSPAPRCARY